VEKRLLDTSVCPHCSLCHFCIGFVSGRGHGATLVRFILAYAASRQLNVTIDISDPLPRAQTYYERYGIVVLICFRTAIFYINARRDYNGSHTLAVNVIARHFCTCSLLIFME
jgi:hypothetical protein